MDRPIGYSTGALALGDFRRALSLLDGGGYPAVELSALREPELEPLLRTLPSLDLCDYSHVSFHVPSRFAKGGEERSAGLLREMLPERWPLIAHPDVLSRPELWRPFGSRLCLENMDKRKPFGRTLPELRRVFERFPEATWCFDIGHARQIDPTMCEAALMLREFAGRLAQVHISEVTSRCRHEPISYSALRGFRKVAGLIPGDVPVIIEAKPRAGDLAHEAAMAAAALEGDRRPPFDEAVIRRA